MAWLFLGAVALPFAALAYMAFERVLPRLMEPVPITEEAAPSTPRTRRLPAKATTSLRLGIGALALALIAFAAYKARPTPNATVANPAQPSAAPAQPQLQFPAPTPLQIAVRFGSDGSAPSQMHDARDLAVDSAGNIWVADAGNHRLLKFKPDGTPLGQWTTSGQGTLAEPSALAVAKDGIIVLDSETGLLHKYSLDGQPVAGFEHDLHLAHPRGIAIAQDGTMWVASTASNAVVKVAPDGSLAGSIPNLNQPASLAVDSQGNLYVNQPDTRRLDKLGPDGALIARWSSPGSTTVLPPRLAVESDGLLATAPGENLIVRYAPNGMPASSFSAVSADGGPPPQRPIGLFPAAGGKSLWVLWNASSTVTQLALPA